MPVVLERVKGLVFAHRLSLLALRAGAASACDKNPGRRKRNTVALSLRPSSPLSKPPNTKGTQMGAFSIGAGKGTRTLYLSLEG